jgi:hypothetical protein
MAVVMAQPRQLNATETPDIQGPAGAIIGRVAHFARGMGEARGGLPAAAGAAGPALGDLAEVGAAAAL